MPQNSIDEDHPAFRAVKFMTPPVLDVLSEQDEWVQFWACDQLAMFLDGVERFGTALTPVELEGVVSSFTVHAVASARTIKGLQDIILGVR